MARQVLERLAVLDLEVGHNKAAAALANKLARITWAVWKNDRNFEIAPEPQAA